MKATPLAAFAALFLAALCAVSPGAASAQASRGDIFTVAGVQVDETAANAPAAQQQGFASAQRLGFERLARRITSPADQARLSMPAPDGPTLDRLARSVDVEAERRSATRYIARLTVRYDPDGVRALLRQAGFTLIETRAAPILIVAQAPADASPDVQAAWVAVWSEGGFAQELVPLIAMPSAPTGPPAWTSVAPNAQAEAAASAIYATLSIQGSSVSAHLTEVAPNAAPLDRGTLSAPLAGSDAAAMHAALLSLAQQANDAVQQFWKARQTGVVAQQRSRMSASALYTDEQQWERIKAALQGAAATVISEIRIEAVAREGALVSFSFTGTRDQLAAELARRGVSLQDTNMGPVLRIAAAPAH